MNWRVSGLCAIVGVGLCSLPVGRSQTNGMDGQLSVVVKLRIRHSAQSAEETAAGLFIGKDRQNAYFITACHAVVLEGVPVQSVQLQFRSSPQSVKANLFNHYEPALDLAVVYTSLANLPQDLPEVVRKDASLGVPIHVIGHPVAGDWSLAAGVVQNLTTATGDIHHFTTSRDNSLAEGHSGGPVYDPQGAFLGMHIASGPTYGIEAKSAEIVNQLAAWHVPTNNLTTVVSDSGNANLQADRDAIAGVVDAYVSSYNRKDAQALWKIWANPPAKTKTTIEEYFGNARSINMKLADRRIETNGTNATVTGQSSQEFTPRNGNLQKSPESPITLELEKRNGVWVITLVR